MSAMPAADPQTAPALVVFADHTAGAWGIWTGGDEPSMAVGRITDAELNPLPASADLEACGAWLLAAAGVKLRLETRQATSTTQTTRHRLTLCRATGSVTLGDHELELDAGGASTDMPELSSNDSVRLLVSSFPDGNALALLAERPRDSRGHDRDLVSVVAAGEAQPLILDPRLSTTYDSTGTPRRVGLELWLAEALDGDQLPRRVAGQASGSKFAGKKLSAYAFICTSRGEPGAGVYVLAR